MKSVKRLVTITLIIVLCVLLYYYYVNKDSRDSGKLTSEEQLSEVEKVLLKDLDANYPTTPLEVVKFFTRIQKCYYNEDNTDEVVRELSDLARKLFDDELLAKNPETEYFDSLKEEIQVYKKKHRTITNIIFDKTTDVVYYTVDQDVHTASLKCTYYVQSGKQLVSDTEVYVLRKDINGRWKIYGWMTDEPSQWER